MSRVNKLLFMVLLLVIFLCIGFIKFYLSIKNYKSEENTNIQGIAVLTGGKGRIAEGIKIFRENPGSYLLISGVDKSIEIEEIIEVIID